MSTAQTALGLRVALIEEISFDEGADCILFLGHRVRCLGGLGLYIVNLGGSHDDGKIIH